MADRLVQEGSKVIAVGRRQDRPDDFVGKHGKDKASAVKFDISDRENMDNFVEKSVLSLSITKEREDPDISFPFHSITTTYPDLDCVS